MGERVSGNLIISLIGPQCGIRISRSVVSALGWPQCICFLKSENKQTMAIGPCPPGQPLAMAVPKEMRTNRERKMRIYCKQFTDELFRANGMDPTQNYAITGEYNENLNAVVFPLKVL